MARTITIRYNDEDAFNEVTQNTKKEVEKVVGYLSLWAIHANNKQTVKMFFANNGDVSASYYDNDGKLTYELYGMRGDDGSYSTHS